MRLLCKPLSSSNLASIKIFNQENHSVVIPILGFAFLTDSSDIFNPLRNNFRKHVFLLHKVIYPFFNNVVCMGIYELFEISTLA